MQRFAENGDRLKLSVSNTRRIERILRELTLAKSPEELDLPGWRLHRLVGDQKGRYAVTASGNWRVTFGWSAQDAIEVDLEDYH